MMAKKVNAAMPATPPASDHLMMTSFQHTLDFIKTAKWK